MRVLGGRLLLVVERDASADLDLPLPLHRDWNGQLGRMVPSQSSA